MADMFEDTIRRARSQVRRNTTPPPLFLVKSDSEDVRERAGRLWLASLWSVLAVALLPRAFWPLALAPSTFGLAVFTWRAWRARTAASTEAAFSSAMQPHEALQFGVVSLALLGGLALGGRGALFLLPLMGGLLLANGRRLPGAWKALADRSESSSRPDEGIDGRRFEGTAVAPLLDAMPPSRRAAFVDALCRSSVRHTLTEASHALRLALSTRPRNEEDLRSELDSRFGSAVVQVAITEAVRRRAVRRCGELLATAMDGVYRAA